MDKYQGYAHWFSSCNITIHQNGMITLYNICRLHTVNTINKNVLTLKEPSRKMPELEDFASSCLGKSEENV
jgi:hypothetical protein